MSFDMEAGGEGGGDASSLIVSALGVRSKLLCTSRMAVLAPGLIAVVLEDVVRPWPRPWLRLWSWPHSGLARPAWLQP